MTSRILSHVRGCFIKDFEIPIHNVRGDRAFKDVRSLRVDIDRALIFGYDLHKHFMQLILKFGQYLQHSLFIT